MDDVDLRLLRVLDRLLQRASVTGAARDLGVGQPSVSRSLQRLRQQLGDPLLVRSGRSMVRTRLAEHLAPRVREALVAAEAVLQPSGHFDPSSATGALRIALGDDVQSWLVVPLLERLHADVPNLDLRVQRLDFETPAALTRDELDLAIVPDLQALPGLPVTGLDHLVHRPLLPARFVVASRQARVLDLDAFCAARHVLVTPMGDSDRGFVDELLAAQGRARRVWATVPTFEQACRLSAGTDAIALLPERVVRAWGPPLHALPVPLRLPELGQHLLWAPHTTTRARHRALRELVLEVVRAVGR